MRRVQTRTFREVRTFPLDVTKHDVSCTTSSASHVLARPADLILILVIKSALI